MTGYVVIDKPELKIREFEEYRAYYCGLCSDLREKYGIKGQLTLNYDMTFLAMLLTGLYDTETCSEDHKCIAHPFVSQTVKRNIFTGYAADMNILLSYYKLMDDWTDEKKLTRKALADILAPAVKKTGALYPEKAGLIASELNNLSEYEKKASSDIDSVAGCFGRIMGTVFSYKHDEWEEYLYKSGFYLGKYVYILDAYADYDEDIKAGRYNPLINIGNDADTVKTILTMMMGQCTEAFEMLPIIENGDILKNILYSGVWAGYNAKHAVKIDGADL